MSGDAQRSSGAASLADIYDVLGSRPDDGAAPGAPPKAGAGRRARLTLPVPQRPALFRGAAAIWARAQFFDGRPEPGAPDIRAGGYGGSARAGDAALRPAPARPAGTAATGAAPTLRLAVLLVLLVAVGAAGAFAAASFTTKVYAARSEIAFDLRGLGWDAAERFLATQVVIGESRALLAPIGAAFGIPVRELEERAKVETVGSSGVIRLQYADPSGAVALEVTRVLTARYLAEVGAFGRAEPAGHWILTPAFLLEEPIAPKPLRAAALGALAGLLVWGALILLRPLARPGP